MKLKLGVMLNSIEILNKLNLEKFKDGITTYKFARNIKNINKELTYFNETREKLTEQYGEKKDEIFKILPQNRDEFIKQINNLLNQEIDVDILTIDPKNLSGYSPVELMSIDWMLEIEGG